jgi:hypothetical protein
VIGEAYRQTKSGGGKLKLRALALLAEGGVERRFEAATLYREAARSEAHALRMLAAPDATTRLGAAVERCGCFVRAMAPTAAAVAWGDVLVESEGVSPAEASALRERLDREFATQQRAHREAIVAAPTLHTAGFVWPAVANRARALRELKRLLTVFPGEVELWHLLHHARLSQGEVSVAWEALGRARALEPESLALLGSELLLAPRALDLGAAEERLDAAWGSLRRGSAELDADVCLCFALASLTLARRSARPLLHLERTGAIVDLGVAAALDSTHAKERLRAVRALLGELRAGREPGVDALYRAGLGDLVTRSALGDGEDAVLILAGGNARQFEALRMVG